MHVEDNICQNVRYTTDHLTGILNAQLKM